MQDLYLTKYIRENFHIEPTIFDSIRYELDNHIYSYGQQFISPRESGSSAKNILKNKAKEIVKRIIILLGCFTLSKKATGRKVILSNAYFSINNELSKVGFDVYRPIWANPSRDTKILIDLKTYNQCEYIKKALREELFINIIDSEFIEKIYSFKSCLNEYFEHYQISALFVPNDVSFFENLSIRIFKEIVKPSFIFLHGLPGRYNSIDENRSDYLIVWGEKIKEHYIQAGISEKKIFVSGHPYYKEMKKKELKFDLDAPLVLTKSMLGAHHSDGVYLSDRGNLIIYLYSIQSVLSKFGVKQVRFRTHPSENSRWYLKFIDNDFFKIDKDSLQDSLYKSTVVIGPASTVFLESLYYGVNYVCYEPSFDNIDLLNSKVAPPFDGSDSRLPVAKNENELGIIIKYREIVNVDIFNDYIKTPFDLNFIYTLI